jgi:carbamoyl-phosphate synthase large subunit
MKPNVRILLTGAGSPAAPGVIQSLRRSGRYDFDITGIDCNPDAVGFHLADRHYVGPRASEERFIPFALQVCSEQNIDVLFSLVTDELIKLSENEAAFFKLGTRLCISPVESLKMAINKGSLYTELQKAGMAVPAFRIVNSPRQLKQAIRDLGYPQQPVCFKPTVSDGSRGFHILDADLDRFDLLFRQKPNSAYVSETELSRIIRGRKELPELIVMEYLPGEEYSVDVLADRGSVVAAVPRLREATAGGITIRSIIREERDIIAYAAMTVEKLQLHGNIGVQIRRDRHNQPKIVEINPRMQGTIVHCTAAGINLPDLAVMMAMGAAPNEEELNIEWGTRMIRYWKEVYYHADGSPYAL